MQDTLRTVADSTANHAPSAIAWLMIVIVLIILLAWARSIWRRANPQPTTRGRTSAGYTDNDERMTQSDREM